MSTTTARMLKSLHMPLTILGAVFVISVLIAHTAWQYRETAARARKAAGLHTQQLQQKTRQLQADEHSLRDQIARYRQLEMQGIIGPERRLDWVELLRSIQDEHKLFAIDYEFSPQMQVPAGQLPLAPSGHDIYTSSMRLNLPLLHEEDLTLTLRELRRRASALIRVRECRIRPLQTRADQQLGPQLDASCQLDWITLRPKAEGKQP